MFPIDDELMHVSGEVNGHSTMRSKSEHMDNLRLPWRQQMIRQSTNIEETMHESGVVNEYSAVRSESEHMDSVRTAWRQQGIR